jgi:hypothetical protein
VRVVSNGTIVGSTPVMPPPPATIASTASVASVQDQAAKVQAALKEASANPMSSYYDPPNVAEIPPRPYGSEAAPITAAAVSRAPALAADISGGGSFSGDGTVK